MRKPNLDRRFNHYNREYTLILIHQAYFLLKRLLERYKTDFLEQGALKNKCLRQEEAGGNIRIRVLEWKKCESWEIIASHRKS